MGVSRSPRAVPSCAALGSAVPGTGAVLRVQLSIPSSGHGTAPGAGLRLRGSLGCQKQNRGFQNTALSFPRRCGTTSSLCSPTGQGSFYSKSKYWSGLGPNGTFLSICIADFQSSEPSSPAQEGKGMMAGTFGAVPPPTPRLWSNFTFLVAVTWTRLLFENVPNELNIPKD